MSVDGATVLCPHGHVNRGDRRFCVVCGASIEILDWPEDVDTSPAKRRVLAVSGVAIAVLIVVGVAAFIVFAPSSQDNAEQRRSDGFAAGTPSAISTGPIFCPAPPTIRAESMELRAEGLAVDAAFLSPCPGEPLEADAELRITVTDGQRDIAAGAFDFATYPLELEPSLPARRTLIFPPGMYWRTPDMVPETPTVTAHRGAAAPAGVTPPKTSGFDLLLAAAPAVPEHGSVNGVARAVLEELRSGDYSGAVADLANRWVPQLSSMRVGQSVDGLTATAADVLREHLALRQQFSGARLLWSGHWSTFDSPDWWATVVGPPKLSATEANRWCDVNGFAVDECFAKFVSSAAGVKGTTVYRE